MSVSNGQLANQTTFNNAFMSRTTNTSTTGKVDLNQTDTDAVQDAQRELNAIARYTGKTTNTPVSTAPDWADNTVGASSDSLFDRIEAVQTVVTGSLTDKDEGGVLFGNLDQDATRFYYNSSSGYLGINADDPKGNLEVDGSFLLRAANVTLTTGVLSASQHSHVRITATDASDLETVTEPTENGNQMKLVVNVSETDIDVVGTGNIQLNAEVLTLSDGKFILLIWDHLLGVWHVLAGGSASGFANPMTTEGDVIYGGTAGLPTRLAVGTTTRVLTSNGTIPSWEFPNAGIATKTSAYTLTAADSVILAGASGGAFTLTLPSPSGIAGKRFFLKKTDSNFNNVTIASASYNSALHTQNESVEIMSDGTSWIEIRRTIPSAWLNYTPTGTWISNTTYNGQFRRVGDSAEFQVSWITSGAPTSTPLLIAHPAGIVISTTKLASTGTIGAANVQSFGTVQYSDVGVRAFQGHVTYSGSTANVAITYSDPAAASNSCTQASPFTWAANDSGSAIYKFPVSGWNG